MADGSKKSTTKKPSSSSQAPKPEKKKELSDADLVEALMKVQRRSLATVDFGAVTRTIKLLSPNGE